jgi:hypothetical protein
MICVRGPVRGINRLPTVCRISYQQTNGGKKASRERPHHVIGCLVDEAGQLGLVGAIHEEESEAVIRVHNLDLGQVIVAIEGESVEDDLAVDEMGLVWARKGTVSNILLDSGSSFRGRYRDLEELERFVFPDLSVSVCQCTPVGMIWIDTSSTQSGYGAESSWHEASINVIGNSTASNTCIRSVSTTALQAYRSTKTKPQP